MTACDTLDELEPTSGTVGPRADVNAECEDRVLGAEGEDRVPAAYEKTSSAQPEQDPAGSSHSPSYRPASRQARDRADACRPCDTAALGASGLLALVQLAVAVMV